MTFKVEFAVTLLVVNLLFTTAIGNTTCPNERQCGDMTCGPTEFCQALFRPCPPPPEDLTTDSPYCPPILVCEEIQCPMEEFPPTQIFCIEGYEQKMIKSPQCEYETPSCVPVDCGYD